MPDPAKRKATYADLEAVPPHLVAEILFGRLVTHPRPVPRHGASSNLLSATLTPGHQWGRGGPGGWIFVTEPQLLLGPHVVVPDLAGWRKDKMPVLPDSASVKIAPDWLCEILSPSTESYDRNEKRRIYAAAGVAHIWLLDPRVKYLECFQLVAGNWLLTHTFSNDEAVRAPPFEATDFPLSQLFASSDTEETSE
jgi:Uma2 family endonuclease